jgi:predicted aspartyl protease
MTSFRLSRRGLIWGGFAGMAASSAWAQELQNAVLQPDAPEAPVLPSASIEDPDTSVDTGVDRNLRLTAPVRLNGKGSFNFLLDTGANRSAISAGTADRLGLRRGKVMRINTMLGPADTPSAVVDELIVGDRVLRKLNVPVLPNGGVAADGMLGIDWLKGQRLVLDMEGGRLEIRKTRSAMQAGATIVPARLKHGQLTIIDADVNGRGRLNCMIDSGSEISVGNSHLRALAASRSDKFEKSIQNITLVDAVNRTFPGQMGYLPFVRIGGVQFGNLPVVFADSKLLTLWGIDREPSLMMGMDVLKEFSRVEMDFGQSRVGFSLATA